MKQKEICIPVICLYALAICVLNNFRDALKKNLLCNL